MATYIKVKDAPAGKLTLGTSAGPLTLIDGGGVVNGNVLKELREFGLEFDEAPEELEKMRAAAREQYETGENRVVAEALGEAIVGRGINTTTPPLTPEGAPTNAISPDEESPTVVQVKQEALSGEYEEGKAREAEDAQLRREMEEEQAAKGREAIREQEAVGIGVPLEKLKVGVSEQPDEEKEPYAADTSLSDTEKKTSPSVEVGSPESGSTETKDATGLK